MNNEDRDSRERGGGGFFSGFVLGAIAGGVVAYMITQNEAREALLGKAREAGSAAMDATGDLRSKVSDVASSWQSNAADLYARGKTVVEGARSNVDEAVSEGQATSAQIRDELSAQSNEIRE